MIDDTRLSGILREELDLSRGFLSLLREEETALVAGDSERLTEIVRRKSEIIGRIAPLAEERNRMVPNSAIVEWLKRHPDSMEVWKELIHLSGLIRASNETNGAIIDTRLRSNQQALSMLQHLAGRTTSLYGPDGHSSVSSGRYDIDRA